MYSNIFNCINSAVIVTFSYINFHTIKRVIKIFVIGLRNFCNYIYISG